MFLSVVIATRGRASVLTETLASIRQQTRLPDEILIVGTCAEDIPGQIPAGLLVHHFLSERGSSRQRNFGISNLHPKCELVTFLDDDVELASDYIDRVVGALGDDPRLAGCGGEVIRDGVKIGGIGREDARQFVREGVPPERGQVLPTATLYGCNMTFRRSCIADVSFDQRLPLYGWLEDMDFCFHASKRGGLACVRSARLVHMGVSGGRVSGRSMGFAQIMNPYYLCRKKGVLRFSQVLRNFWMKGIASNLVKSIKQPANSTIDFKGRAYGNLIALKDVCLGRVRPERGGEL